LYVKVKVIPVQAMKACRVRRGVDPLILSLGVRWRWVLSVIPQSPYLWERTLVCIEYAAG